METKRYAMLPVVALDPPGNAARSSRALALALALSLAGGPPSAPAQKALTTQRSPRTVIELQPFRSTTTVSLVPATDRGGRVTLTNLNPHVNAWFLLQWQGPDGKTASHHIVNREPLAQRLVLDQAFPNGIEIRAGNEGTRCELWGGKATDALEQAQRLATANAPLCGGRLYLRNQTRGNKSSKEWATDFLRTYVPGGERITSFVRDTFYKDAYRTTSQVVADTRPGADPPANEIGFPAQAQVKPRYQDHDLVPAELGIALERDTPGRVRVGRWYRATGLPGVFVSAIEPSLVADEVIEAQRKRVRPLDEIEATSLVFLVAFDLTLFEPGFMLGTEHPRVGWSELLPQSLRDPSLPGPDGFDTVAPLVRTGLLTAEDPARIAAAFVGGFKRYHGAFRRGELSTRNNASHYGFMESGVVMSTLQPGLATVVGYLDGTLELKTWNERDNLELSRVRFARQNGVPLIEFDAATATSGPGAFVAQSQLGNWSASHDRQYRTLRSGLCSQIDDGRHFLLFGYFSSATPSAMARVFQAYRCRYAMMLDINALEHTYLSVYRSSANRFEVQNLVKGMSELDKVVDGHVVPRFVGYADNRDFFYLLRYAQ